MYKLYTFFDMENADDEFIEKCLTVLPQNRREKALRFVHITDRNTSVISYLLMLYGIRDLFGIKDTELCYGSKGKPYCKNHPNIFFNISHCKNGCICAVGDNDLGADIQEKRSFNPRMLKKICTAEEENLINSSKDKEKAFTKMWTQKESYVKMKSCGISSDLKLADTIKYEKYIDSIEINGCWISVCESKRIEKGVAE
ncbi:MAG: 4'-phosphopantetheinyl transferase family protein [Oscillospiraceae bacterium]